MSASETARLDAVAAEQAQPAVRFCKVWLAATIALVVLAAVFNVVVDPFLVFGSPRVAGFNALKPTTALHTALAKDHLIVRAQPAGLALGTSKVDIGLDPESPLWPNEARPVFNDGVPGLDLPGMLARLQSALQLRTVHRVLVMVELADLMVVPSPPVPAQAADRFGWLRARSGELVSVTLSIDALRASLATVVAQHQRNVIDLSAAGSTNDGMFRRAVASDGFDTLFLQKDKDLVAMLGHLARTVAAAPSPAVANLGAVAAIIDLCRQNGVALDLAITPYHADYLDIIAHAGLWPRYEAAKTELTRLVGASGGGVRLWDFMGFDRYSADPVPGPGDLTGGTQWFWEPSHFKRPLGEKILAAIYHGATDYGAELTPDQLPARLEAERRARDAYEEAGNASGSRLRRSGLN